MIKSSLSLLLLCSSIILSPHIYFLLFPRFEGRSCVVLEQAVVSFLCVFYHLRPEIFSYGSWSKSFKHCNQVVNQKVKSQNHHSTACGISIHISHSKLYVFPWFRTNLHLQISSLTSIKVLSPTPADYLFLDHTMYTPCCILA